MLRQRVLTAAVGIPLFVGTLYLGGGYWGIFLALVAVLGAGESYRLAGGKGAGAWFGRLLAFSFVLDAYHSGGDGDIGQLFGWLPVLLLTALFVAFALASPKEGAGGLRGAGAALAAGVYPGLFLAHLLLLRKAGFEPALLAVLVTWATDTGAYTFGSLVGKRPLWPAISPKKTVEGAAGGLISGVAIGAALALLWQRSLSPWLAVAAVASIAAQLGDLVESGFKRKAGVKDSGNLLPGHGGVLDRFDSLFFAGSAVYYLATLL